MQTFLPSYNFYVCAQTLDRKRLFKQVVEARQLLDILVSPDTSNATAGQRNHPALNYWREQVPYLHFYLKILAGIYNARFGQTPLTTREAAITCREVWPERFYHPDFVYLSHKVALHVKQNNHDHTWPHVINYVWRSRCGKFYYTGQLSRRNTQVITSIDDWVADCHRRFPKAPK